AAEAPRDVAASPAGPPARRGAESRLLRVRVRFGRSRWRRFVFELRNAFQDQVAKGPCLRFRLATTAAHDGGDASLQVRVSNRDGHLRLRGSKVMHFEPT